MRRQERDDAPAAELAELALWLANRGYAPGQGCARECPKWVAARQDWATERNDGWPAESWRGVPMGVDTREAAWHSADIDAIAQRRDARRTNTLG